MSEPFTDETLASLARAALLPRGCEVCGRYAVCAGFGPGGESACVACAVAAAPAPRTEY